MLTKGHNLREGKGVGASVFSSHVYHSGSVASVFNCNLPDFSTLLTFFLNNSFFTSEDQKSFQPKTCPHSHL